MNPRGKGKPVKNKHSGFILSRKYWFAIKSRLVQMAHTFFCHHNEEKMEKAENVIVYGRPFLNCRSRTDEAKPRAILGQQLTRLYRHTTRIHIHIIRRTHGFVDIYRVGSARERERRGSRARERTMLRSSLGVCRSPHARVPQCAIEKKPPWTLLPLRLSTPFPAAIRTLLLLRFRLLPRGSS